MRQNTILGLSALIVVGAVWLAVHSNNQYVQKTRASVTVAAQHARQELTTNKKLQAEVKTDSQVITALQAQCGVGVKDYGLLTTVQRVQAVEPNCSVDTAIAK